MTSFTIFDKGDITNQVRKHNFLEISLMIVYISINRFKNSTFPDTILFSNILVFD